MMYDQGEIVIVPFPFSDLSSIKQRPVLIISKTNDNKNSEDIIACGITSNIKNAPHSVLIGNEHLEEGDIPRQSRIKLDKLFTINQELVRKSVAKLNKETLTLVKNEFKNLV